MNNNKTLNNKSGFISLEDKRIFSNTYLISFIILISLFFVGYAVYYQFTNAEKYLIKENSSFYGKDLLNYEPLFNSIVPNIQNCIDTCNNDILCDGITYNNVNKMCIGTKNGEMRNESGDYSAWIKPLEVNENKKINFKNSVLVGYTNTFRMITKDKIFKPFQIGHFAFSFNLLIKDFYKNYGYWRHIFHKGTHIEPGKTLAYQSWENLINEIPNQSIGVWMAPFTNNLRVAITTNTVGNLPSYKYKDAYVQVCDDNDCYVTDLPSGKWADRRIVKDNTTMAYKPKIDKFIEFIDNDLQNIPINTKLNITINVIDKIVEIYFNGKIVKITQLEGTPALDTNNLYVFNEYTINGEISNILYYPDSLKLQNVKDIIDLSDNTN